MNYTNEIQIPSAQNIDLRFKQLSFKIHIYAETVYRRPLDTILLFVISHEICICSKPIPLFRHILVFAECSNTRDL